MTSIPSPLLYLLIYISQFAAAQLLRGRQSLSGRAPYATSNISLSATAVGTSIPVINGSHNSTSHLTSSQSQLGLITASPTVVNQTYTYPYEIVSSCTEDPQWCSAAGIPLIQSRPTSEGLPNECLLWDDTCSGNRTLALKEFFSYSIHNFTGHVCLDEDGDETIECEYVPPVPAEEYEKIMTWMRSPQCVSDALDYGNLMHIPTSNLQGLLGPASLSPEHPGSCCSNCEIWATNVEIYYWPEPNASMSCLSVVGDEINPLDLGATTSGTHTYWGCTPKTPLQIYDLPATNFDPVGAYRSVESIITTATIVTIGSATIKEWAANPWSSQGCDYEDSLVKNISVLSIGPLRARGHSLNMHSITKQSGSPVMTAISGTFTL